MCQAMTACVVARRRLDKQRLGESCVAGIEMVRTEQGKQTSDYTWASECFLYLLKD